MEGSNPQSPSIERVQHTGRASNTHAARVRHAQGVSGTPEACPTHTCGELARELARDRVRARTELTLRERALRREVRRVDRLRAKPARGASRSRHEARHDAVTRGTNSR